MKMFKPEQPEIQLWTRMRNGDEGAFSKLVKTQFNFLLNYGYRFVKDSDFVKDCVQEVFIEIWQKKDRLVVPESVRAYLLTCVRKKVIREGKRQRILKEEPDFLEEQIFGFNSSFETEWIEAETSAEIYEKVKKLITRLPKRQQEVLYLQYYQNLSRDEIAEIMQINLQSVSNLVQSAFSSFRHHWSAIMLAFFIWVKEYGSFL